MAFPYLIVRARGRLCALPVEQVVETMRPPALAGESSRQTSELRGWLGTTTVRGELVTVLNLAALLGFAEDAGVPEPMARAVSVRLGQAPVELGSLLVVDEVIGVKRLAPEHLRRIDLPGGGELPMGRFDEGFARLIDASRLLDAAELARLGAPEELLKAEAETGAAA